jgi:hypothetical protein
MVSAPLYTWEKVTAQGTSFYRDRPTWWRCVPNGSARVCPQCEQVLAERNARELRRDCALRRHDQITYGAMFAFVVICMLLAVVARPH